MNPKDYIKTNWALTGNLSTWNDPVGVEIREQCVKLIEELHKEDMVEFDRETLKITERLINESNSKSIE